MRFNIAHRLDLLKAVDLADIAFEIHSMPAGGGTLAISPMPGRTRHYFADWQRLASWKPALVISMTQQHELERKGAGSLGQDLANAGIAWWHAPVADFGVPEDLDWDRLCGQALATLGQNKRVLVHCFGGCGRSGMVALRLMIAAGEDANTALNRLRAVRPCAVETPQQMDWALLG